MRNFAKRTSSLLWPLLVVACTVETPVADRDGDNLVPDLQAWCEARCVDFIACGIDDDASRCVENCVTYFGEAFTKKGETCENAGDRLMDCVERRGCEGVTVGESCGFSAEEMHCVTSDGRTFCDSGWTGSSMGLNPALECELGFDECSDGSEYLLTCLGAGDPPDCYCMTDDVTTGRFSPSRGECPYSDAEHICGWPIAVTPGEPWSDLPVTCATHNSAVTDARGVVTDCEIWFDDCSDERSYEIECGSTGSAACTCTIDGMLVSTFQPMNAVCPFALDPDGGAAAMNYACGFRIAPPESQP